MSEIVNKSEEQKVAEGEVEGFFQDRSEAMRKFSIAARMEPSSLQSRWSPPCGMIAVASCSISSHSWMLVSTSRRKHTRRCSLMSRIVIPLQRWCAAKGTHAPSPYRGGNS